MCLMNTQKLRMQIQEWKVYLIDPHYIIRLIQSIKLIFFIAPQILYNRPGIYIINPAFISQKSILNVYLTNIFILYLLIFQLYFASFQILLFIIIPSLKLERNNFLIQTNCNNKMNTKQLKQFVETQVFEILTDIKQEIQTKIKDIDLNIVLMKKEINALNNKNINNSENTIHKKQSSYLQLAGKIQAVQKQIQILKQISGNQNNLYVNSKKTDMSTASYSTSIAHTNLYSTNNELIKTLPYKKDTQNHREAHHQNSGKSQKQIKNNQPNNVNSLKGLAKDSVYKKQIYQNQSRYNFDNFSASNTGTSPQIFKRTSQNSFDLSSLLFDDLEDDFNLSNKKQQVQRSTVVKDKLQNQKLKHKIQQRDSQIISQSQFQHRIDRNSNYIAGNSPKNMAKIVSPLSNPNKQKKPPLPTAANLKYNESPFQPQTNRRQLPEKIVEKQLIKNKNSFLRQKSNGQIGPTIQQEQEHLEKFQQINVELEYSKDSIDNFNTETGSKTIGLRTNFQRKW